MLSVHPEVQGNPKSEFDKLTKRTHMPLGQVLLRYREALSALGLRDPVSQRLGLGSFGAAYETKIGGGSSVLKLTRDPYEVVTSLASRGRDFEHVVPIYEVWSLAETQKKQHWAAWFVVHRAYLKPLTAKDKKLVDILFEIFVEDDLDVPETTSGHRAMRSKWELYVKEDLGETWQKSELDRAMELLRQIATGMKELRSIGIDWEDFHSGNLMIGPKGAIMIADVGYGVPRRTMHHEIAPLTIESAQDYARTFTVP